MGRLPRVVLAFGMLLLVGSVVSGLAAANTVPGTNLGRFSAAIMVNSLKPSACSAIVVTNLVVASGVANATTTAPNGVSSLVLGSAANETLTGGNQADCILGGAGNDTLNGRAGNDVLIGGPNDAAGDTCNGGTGTNTLIECAP